MACYYCFVVVVNLWPIASSIYFMRMRTQEVSVYMFTIIISPCGFMPLSELKGYSLYFLINGAWNLFCQIKIETPASFPFL